MCNEGKGRALLLSQVYGVGFRVQWLELENNYFTEKCSGSEAGSYLRLIDFVFHSTLGLRDTKKKRRRKRRGLLVTSIWAASQRRLG